MEMLFLPNVPNRLHVLQLASALRPCLGFSVCFLAPPILSLAFFAPIGYRSCLETQKTAHFF
jgi:hypothetical protein